MNKNLKNSEKAKSESFKFLWPKNRIYWIKDPELKDKLDKDTCLKLVKSLNNNEYNIENYIILSSTGIKLTISKVVQIPDLIVLLNKKWSV